MMMILNDLLTSRKKRGYWLIAALFIGVIVLIGVVWQMMAPITVYLTATAKELPFEIEAIPNTVSIRPGEVISVTYLIRNTVRDSIGAFGHIEIEPVTETDNVEVFLTECGGINLYRPLETGRYNVVFRVKNRLSWWGKQEIVLNHVFDRVPVSHEE